jgi:hypothetical protein
MTQPILESIPQNSSFVVKLGSKRTILSLQSGYMIHSEIMSSNLMKEFGIFITKLNPANGGPLLPLYPFGLKQREKMRLQRGPEISFNH